MEKGAKIKLNFSKLLRSHCVPVEKRHPVFNVISAAFGPDFYLFFYFCSLALSSEVWRSMKNQGKHTQFRSKLNYGF